MGSEILRLGSGVRNGRMIGYAYGNGRVTMDNGQRVEVRGSTFKVQGSISWTGGLEFWTDGVGPAKTRRCDVAGCGCSWCSCLWRDFSAFGVIASGGSIDLTR